MTGYSPIKIAGFESGLIQDREEFLLPNDAFPTLYNSYIFRERIRRKLGSSLIGRLRRNFMNISLGPTGTSPWTFNLFTLLPMYNSSLNFMGETYAEIEPGIITLIVSETSPTPQTITFTDNGQGVFTANVAGNSGTINYITGSITLVLTATSGTATISFTYFPTLPAMGSRLLQLNTTNNEQTIVFDTKYAYRFAGSNWQELPSTTPTIWTGDDADFFWTTNFGTTGTPPRKLFWATNFSGPTGDPIRYYDGLTWTNFSPNLDSTMTPVLLTQCLCIIPYRSRLLALNTWEGTTLPLSQNFPQRIRWAAIGDPLATNGWNDTIGGKGGFLDIPTSEDIISCGFVRDNLVIYCESSTWQLRYSGIAASPFIIERVNSELGSESTFSAIQFDTALVGIGDKGIVSCDSYASVRIDIKIPNLIFQIESDNSGTRRVQGIRKYEEQLAYWIYPYTPDLQPTQYYPNRRLVYNYENESWAIFSDSYTCLGPFQPAAITWSNAKMTWAQAAFPWTVRPSLIPEIAAGNQQGYVMMLDQQVTNDTSLTIRGITGNTTTATTLFCPNHNLETGTVIKISDIPSGSAYSSLNGFVFGIDFVDLNNFNIYLFDPETNAFDNPQLNLPATYIAGGQISVLDNFIITSKKFNFMDDGQSIQFGYLDLLAVTTSAGAISLNVYQDYNDDVSVNGYIDNDDVFFNRIIPTTPEGPRPSSKSWHKVFCPCRGSFITLEFTLSNSQMNGIEQSSNVQIDAFIVWVRRAGKLESGF